MATQEGVQAGGVTEEQGKALLWLARKTIAHRLGMEVGEPEPGMAARLREAALQEKRGTFVCLKEHGELRGCIGSLVATDSIVEGVKRNALHAAFGDSRFRPVGKEEFGTIELEVSILTEPAPLAYTDPADLLRTLRAGVDGVILRKGLQSATFLPQVWEQLPRSEDFLGCLCRKAGLPAEAWRSGELEVFTYRVQCFGEHG